MCAMTTPDAEMQLSPNDTLWLNMDTPENLVCDHVNHEGLDNRIANLRNCTVEQNNANRRSARHASSRFLGVAWDRRRNKWVAYIKKDGKQKTLGLFDDEVEAARAHDSASRQLHGPFAHLNFPDESSYLGPRRS